MITITITAEKRVGDNPPTPVVLRVSDTIARGYIPCISSDIVLKRECNLHNPAAPLTISNIRLNNLNGVLDQAGNIRFKGASAKVISFQDSSKDVIDGFIDSASVDSEGVTINIVDKFSLLNTDLHSESLSTALGLTGYGGDESLAPFVLGQVYNIKPIPCGESSDYKFCAHYKHDSEFEITEAYESILPCMGYCTYNASLSSNIIQMKLERVLTNGPWYESGWSYDSSHDAWSCNGTTNVRITWSFGSPKYGSYYVKTKVYVRNSGSTHAFVGGKQTQDYDSTGTFYDEVKGVKWPEEQKSTGGHDKKPFYSGLISDSFNGIAKNWVWRIPDGEFTVDATHQKTNTLTKAIEELVKIKTGISYKDMELHLSSYTTGRFITSKINVISLISELVPDFWYFGFNRKGIFEAGFIGDTNGKGLNISDSDISDKITVLDDVEDISKVIVWYKKNWNPISSDQQHEFSNPGDRTWFAREYEYAEEAISTVYPPEYEIKLTSSKYKFRDSPVSKEYKTYIIDGISAELEANRLMKSFDTCYHILKVPLSQVNLSQVDIGSPVIIHTNMMGGSLSGTYFMLGWEDNLSNNTQTIKLCPKLS